MRRLIVVGGIVLALVGLAVPAVGSGAASTPGVTSKLVTIGGTYPLTGPASLYATIPAAMKAYFSYVNSRKGADGRRGVGVTSLVAGGCIVSGSSLRRSLLFTGVHLHSYGSVENAVILPNVDIGRRVRLKNVVVDANVKIPAGLVVGEDPEADAARFHRSRVAGGSTSRTAGQVRSW